MQACSNCNHFARGRCDVLDEVLLVMSRVVGGKGGEHEISSAAIVKDYYATRFKCNHYKENGGVKIEH